MSFKMVEGQPYREIRCEHCRNLLGDEYIFAGRLRLKCPQCNREVKIDFRTTFDELVKQLKRLKPSVVISFRKGGDKE